jgi:hypothetical protein
MAPLGLAGLLRPHHGLSQENNESRGSTILWETAATVLIADREAQRVLGLLTVSRCARRGRRVLRPGL